MGNKSTTIRIGLLVATVALLVGCSSTRGTSTAQLPEPRDVPREKWSDAMHVLTAMGISGQRDVPIELAGAVDRASPASGSGTMVGDAGLSAVSFASPPTSLSGGAAAGIGLGLMLLGGSSDPVRATQVVAWVPADQASSPEAASALALRKVEEARKRVFANGLSKLPMQTGKYPDGHQLSYASLADSYAERSIAYREEIAKSPSFLRSPLSYGPIFIRDNQFTLDAYKNDMTTSEAMLLASQHLPEWFYIYHPGQRLRKNSIPAAIFNQGRVFYFIGK
ncbi:hypothetical protein [Pseudomonas aeruginosa]|uniref:hypothetical protein n=1 Tax=Pseudomonas aeruginosa TaxID=287 RepID=UPI000B4CB4ED|nr:hypothetical protein [Pseudomonas aeruginosa]ASC99232.1 hypothetical protein CD796_23100 [Pseudomonas aeruginosa]EMB9881257.1 hypothetical protein [Pseudomonas aeruginosa]MBG4404790.1 hypothetical protein [Pseudomonas aeruginosa]MBG5875048.1 hypothetical protein [Pseudomonas aeruginosa]MBG7574550.1 hypothetical protein [Pseudomonas aeruginosa]